MRRPAPVGMTGVAGGGYGAKVMASVAGGGKGATVLAASTALRRRACLLMA